MQKIYSRIDWENEPSTNTPLSESNLNKMDYALDQIDNRVVQLAGYQDRVAQAEKNAKTSEENAKVSETNAKQSELKSKEYMESAFKGTPEGYQEVVEKVDSMEIKTTKENTIKGTKNGGFRLTNVKANTIQNGTPSPANQVPMLSTGDCVEMIQGAHKYNTGIYDGPLSDYICNKNPIPCNGGDVIKIITEELYDFSSIIYYANGSHLSYDSRDVGREHEYATPSGVTHFNFSVRKAEGITPQTAGKITITINGKYVTPIKTHGKNFANPTRNIFVSRLGGVIASKTGFDYVATGSGTAQVVNMYIPIKENTDYAFSFKDKGYINSFGLTFVDSIGAWTNITNKVKSGNSGVHKYALLSWQLDAGYTGTISVYDVQLEVGAETDFEEYRETTAYILTNEPLRAVKLSSANTIETNITNDGEILRADILEKNIITRNVGKSNLKTIAWGYLNGYGNCFIGAIPVDNGLTYSTSYNLNSVMCNKLQSVAPDEQYYSNKACVSYHSEGGCVIVSVENITTQADLQAWLDSAGDIEFYYPIVPTIETLDTQSQIALNSLETFEGVMYVEFDSRVQPLEFEAEVGLTNETARLLKNELRNDTLEVKYNELAVAMVSL